ncbi:(Lyso)-N-acylphosphatidylethanolamine lipase, partial [Pseudolycoriella hygida]
MILLFSRLFTTPLGWFLSWLNWNSTTSLTMLRSAEKRILSYVKTAYRGFYVDIGPVVGEADKVWTISMNTQSPKVPLVMLHGMGAGVAFWVLNLDSLAVHRPVYAIDILGFGRSSRPTFTNDAVIAEKQFVKSIEEWRREMNIQQMILLGHSLGGYLATSYTLSYPHRVKHLILADPWGFQEKPKEIKAPLWVRAIGTVVAPFNPLWALRAAGPYGQWVVEKMRPDILRKFTEVIAGDEENINVMAQYIHQCNAQNPAGESAFHSMMSGFGWARHPMLRRMQNVRHDMPITLLYGSRSWIDKSSWELLKAARKPNYVNVQ